MRAASTIAAAVLAALLISAVPASASGGWVRSGKVYVHWTTEHDRPAAPDSISRSWLRQMAAWRAERAEAIRGAVRAHERFRVQLAAQRRSIAPGPSGADSGPSGGGGRSWGPGAVQDLIRRAFSPSQVARGLCTAYRESHFNPYAKNPHSSAAGVFQFVAASWRTFSRAAGWSGASVFSAVANVNVAAWVVDHYGWSPWGGGCI